MPDPQAPATPPPAVPSTPPADPQAPRLPSIDDDPNVAMSRLVARSRERRDAEAKGEAKPAPAATQKPAQEPEKPTKEAQDKPEQPPPDGPKTLTELLGKALKFTSKPKKPAEQPKVDATEEKEEVEEEEKPEEPAAKPSKKVSKKAPEPIDTAALVREAATAATTAAVKALKPAPVEEEDPADTMSGADRRDYEVAVYMSKSDPRYKDAPRIMLEQIKKAEEYASRWEASNPGKVFDPKSDDHDEFFGSLDRPWSDEEFDDARINMLAERKAEKHRAEQNKELDAIKQDTARVEYAPVVERTFAQTTINLAKAVGDNVHKALTEGGWEALAEEDPFTAKVLAGVLDQMHPFVEATVLLDDPRQRIPLNLKTNIAHQQWNTVVSTGEESLIGQRNEQGKMFARRSEWSKMTEAEQSRHWYLTRDMIIQGAVDYAAKQVKKVTEEQNALLEKMGYVRQQPAKTKSKEESVATPEKKQDTTTKPTVPKDKPSSPGVGSGAKIDDTGGRTQTKTGALLTEMSKILFKS